MALLTAQLGPIDVLMPCAGICGFEVVDDLNVPRVENMLQINFLGVVYAIDAVLPSMLERRSGCIVGIASLAAVRAIPFEPTYCASKAALATYLEGLRPALRRRGVVVTTIYPGFVRTPLLDGLMAAGQTAVPPAPSTRTPVPPRSSRPSAGANAWPASPGAQAGWCHLRASCRPFSTIAS